MSGVNASPTGHGKEPDADGVPLTYEQRVAHLAAGYENSQSVVRFLDTKAAAVIGVVPVLVGILAALFKWLHAALDRRLISEAFAPWVEWIFWLILFVIAGILLVYAYRAVLAALNAILPRHSGESEPSVLFPFETSDFPARLDIFMGHPLTTDVFEDYKRQLSRMSQITAVKLRCVNTSIEHLQMVLLLSVIAVVWMALMAMMGVGSAMQAGEEDCGANRTTAPPPRVAGAPGSENAICTHEHVGCNGPQRQRREQDWSYLIEAVPSPA